VGGGPAGRCRCGEVALAIPGHGLVGAGIAGAGEGVAGLVIAAQVLPTGLPRSLKVELPTGRISMSCQG
jgi:hypothetical protein